MAAGASHVSPPFSLVNTADALTQKYFSPVVQDATLTPSPTWWRLTRLGRKIHGGAIVVPVLSQEETQGGAYWGAQILQTDVVDSIRPAQWEWRPTR